MDYVNRIKTIYQGVSTKTKIGVAAVLIGALSLGAGAIGHKYGHNEGVAIGYTNGFADGYHSGRAEESALIFKVLPPGSEKEYRQTLENAVTEMANQQFRRVPEVDTHSDH
jgi:hypothetical protein